MNSFNAKSTFRSRETDYEIYRLDALKTYGVDIVKLPYSLKILLENLLRAEDGIAVMATDVLALAKWDCMADPVKEIAFTPARVILQDFTGVPCVVDLAAMRDAMANLGGNPKKINPLQPVELVIDHSVQTDAFGRPDAILINRDLEFERNQERYAFLKWGQKAFDNFKVVPPNTGIVHQVNLEFLGRVVFVNDATGVKQAYPDTLVGTDSHTTMINGLGVLGWGVGGIEAEAAMLGQPVSMLIPQVLGFKVTGKLPEGATATDLVLTVTEMLRKKGVVGKFVEFYGPGLKNLALADRATIGNMSPEYGATCAIFPVDDETLHYLRTTGRPEWLVDLVEGYYKEQGLFHDENTPEADYSATLELDLSTIQPSVAGPKRPQDRALLSKAPDSFRSAFESAIGDHKGVIKKVLTAVGLKKDESTRTEKASPTLPTSGGSHSGAVALIDAETATGRAADECCADQVEHGSIVIASITSCTNTSNPSVMTAAGLLAKKAVEKGLMSKPWVKTSLAPGSRVATEILEKAGLLTYLEQLRFNVVGYGCMTCIGNSGPLPDEISKVVNDKNLVVVSVLSGNRNFEGRINQDVKANYLMSPPLVVAFSLAGTIEVDLTKEPLGEGKDGLPVYLKDIWPTQEEIAEANSKAISAEMYRSNYADVYKGDERWAEIPVEGEERYAWPDSTYIKNPPYFEGMPKEAPSEVPSLAGMRVLAMLGDSITTDHISPAGAIKLNSPAGQYLVDHGVEPKMFNSYGSRRGNHEVMVRGTFANIRLRNQLASGTEGGFTTYLPTGEVTTIYAAAMLYKHAGTPLIVIAGKEYGSGSSRDWAAKGSALLGIKVVLAQSFERIHRSNLIGMGVLPLEFTDGESKESLGLTGKETFDLPGFAEALKSGFESGKVLEIQATAEDGSVKNFGVLVRIDTPNEALYYQHGGILQFVLRQLIKA
ncbi:MAG: aconitate hydratase [Fimbriimonadaceae bacterium]|jgi:aconitate hydratase|nr:aconitate hydratase [Fimbriimonadaceae bacterium]